MNTSGAILIFVSLAIVMLIGVSSISGVSDTADANVNNSTQMYDIKTTIDTITEGVFTPNAFMVLVLGMFALIWAFYKM